ncbi:MAG TPA: matrixin family metalloprotease [Gammaproteobacteria bacterium]|nr:matrixin family metalloprotease [Gammaproteobacteria bacterium]
MNNTLTFTGLFFLLISSNLSFAGGPLVLEGAKGNTPVRYQNPNITIHAESGALGALSNNQADDLMRQAFDLWNNTSTATVNLTLDDTQIIEDINLGNFDTYLPDVSGTLLNGDDGLNPIAYDNNGAIIDAFFGAKQSDSTVGFAASIFNVKGDVFLEGYAVINGKQLNPPLTSTEFKLLIAHEIGHLIGLDHSQVNIDNRETDFGTPFICSTASLDKYPVMYPFVCRGQETLHADDISAVSALYPAANFDSNFGSIEGFFVDANGKAILGANLWAENTVTGEVVSGTSDYLAQGNGAYKLNITPGTYTLHANAINPLFNGGSSIGPYASDLSDRSFVTPNPITEVTLQSAVTSGDEIITVSASQKLAINLSSTGNDVVLNNSSGGGSSALSHVTLLLLAGLMLTARRYGSRQLFIIHR